MVQKGSSETIYNSPKNKYVALLTGDGFVLNLNEKESFIAKLESGNLTPSLELAKKLEKYLNIKLIIKEKAEEMPVNNKSKSMMTIGDLLKK